ncbi:hypothetical protein TNCV_520121 [Trichonephila clavipes]|nr:hypothetical protein TNCV_520121 [Trichonephila clavipes]
MRKPRTASPISLGETNGGFIRHTIDLNSACQDNSTSHPSPFWGRANANRVEARGAKEECRGSGNRQLGCTSPSSSVHQSPGPQQI